MNALIRVEGQSIHDHSTEIARTLGLPFVIFFHEGDLSHRKYVFATGAVEEITEHEQMLWDKLVEFYRGLRLAQASVESTSSMLLEVQKDAIGHRRENLALRGEKARQEATLNDQARTIRSQNEQVSKLEKDVQNLRKDNTRLLGLYRKAMSLLGAIARGHNILAADLKEAHRMYLDSLPADADKG